MISDLDETLVRIPASAPLLFVLGPLQKSNSLTTNDADSNCSS